MTDTALKPCPFCGGTDISQSSWDIKCDECNTNLPGDVEAWNTRAAITTHPHPIETAQADVQPVAYAYVEDIEQIKAKCKVHNRVTLAIRSVDYFTVPFYSQAALAALEAERDTWKQAYELASELISDREKIHTAALAECQREKEGLREALTPFARISTEGIAKLTTNYTEVRMLSDYFHTAARVLSAIKKEKV